MKKILSGVFILLWGLSFGNTTIYKYNTYIKKYQDFYVNHKEIKKTETVLITEENGFLKIKNGNDKVLIMKIDSKKPDGSGFFYKGKINNKTAWFETWKGCASLTYWHNINSYQGIFPTMTVFRYFNR